MIDFDLVVGQSVGHALEVLRGRTDAALVAGATDLIPLVRVGRWHPGLVVDITHLETLRYIKPVAGGLEIGALTTHAELMHSPLVLEHAPALVEAAASVAGPQVRARGTLGGNLCTASPAADTVPALLVLDAQVVLTGLESERRLPLAAFLTGPGQTALQSGEILKSVFIPATPPGAGMAFEKLGKRKALIISVVNTAALLVAEGGRIQDARLALGAVAPTVVRCPAAEAFLAGQEPVESTFHEAARLIQETIRPIDDVRASAAYRRVAAEGLAARALARAWEGCAK
jgi:CO/xanthine dehydrogenase FAD-binding subunit